MPGVSSSLALSGVGRKDAIERHALTAATKVRSSTADVRHELRVGENVQGFAQARVFLDVDEYGRGTPLLCNDDLVFSILNGRDELRQMRLDLGDGERSAHTSL